jgi:hypothetical protein
MINIRLYGFILAWILLAFRHMSWIDKSQIIRTLFDLYTMKLCQDNFSIFDIHHFFLDKALVNNKPFLLNIL